MNGIEELEEKLASVSDDAGRLALLNALAFRCSRVDPRRGLQLAEEAEQLAVELDDLGAKAESLQVAAWCYETLSDYPTAMTRAQRARVLFKQQGDRIREGSCLNAIGVIAFGMSQFVSALEALEDARRIFTEDGDKPGIASACNNIGMVHQQLGKYPEALEAYLEALRVNEELGDELQAGIL